MRVQRLAVAVATGVLALGLSACGGDDGDADAGAPSGGGGGAVDVPTDRDLDALGDLLPDDCRFLAAGAFANPAMALAPNGGLDLDDSADRFAALASAAPSEIRDDLELIGDRLQDMAEALKGVDLADPSSYADPKVQASLERLEGIFDDDYEAAVTALDDYVQEHCSRG